MAVVGSRGEFVVLFVDASDAGSPALDPDDDDVVTVVESGMERALDHLAAGEVDCLVVTDAVSDEDPIRAVARARECFDGPVVFAPRDGSEGLASEAVASGADEYVPLEAGDGTDSRDPGRLAERIDAALDRVRAERTEPPYGALLEAVPAGLALVTDGTVVRSNDRFGCELGRGDPEGEDLLDVVPESDREGVRDLLAGATSGSEAGRVVLGGGEDPGPTLHAVGLDVAEDAVAVLATDGPDRRGRAHRLAALHRTTREMVRSGSTDEIAELAVETAVETLDPLAASVYVYDRDGGDLRRAAAASGVVSGGASAATVPEPEGTEEFAWDAFVAGEVRRGSNPPSVPSRVAIPLGDNGVLVLAGETADAFGDADVEFARTLATNAEVAIEAAHRESTLLERTERLRERTATLEGLRRIDDVVRDIGQLLVGATDRAEIERAVCERLAAVEGWSFAWVGERNVAADGLVARAHSGDGQFLEAVSAAEGDPFGGAPASTALETESWQSVEDLVAYPSGATWRDLALEYGLQSVVSIPLVREGRVYGVLEVYGEGTDAFGEAEREVLVELGDMTAYAIHAVERERALHADRGPELVVETTDVDTVFGRFATEADAEVAVDAVVPQSDGDHLVYLTVDADVDRVDDVVEGVARRSSAVRHLRRVGDDSRFEVRLSSAPFVERVAANGGRIREVTATDGRTEARIELPNTLDVREFVEALRAAYPDLEVTAQRSADEESGDARTGITDSLTDRQREVIEVAFHSGFFEWPRESTGEEVAESLGIAAPTYHKHIRSAERKLLTTVLTGLEDGE